MFLLTFGVSSLLSVPSVPSTLSSSSLDSSSLPAVLSRNIELSNEQKERLETGAEKAEAKGMKESLVIVDSYSFIVNVPNKTVVTAMDQKESEENVYTNIDGAVIM